MLVVKAEIWPHGEADERFEIARIGIINRSTSNSPISDYNVIGIHGRDRQEWVAQGVVLDHIRRHGWMPLVSEALAVETPSLFHQEYVDTVVALLKRG